MLQVAHIVHTCFKQHNTPLKLHMIAPHTLSAGLQVPANNGNASWDSKPVKSKEESDAARLETLKAMLQESAELKRSSLKQPPAKAPNGAQLKPVQAKPKAGGVSSAGKKLP